MPTRRFTEPKYIKPKLRAIRARKQSALLRVFAKVGRIYHAARKLGMTLGNHYWWMNTDSSYSERFKSIQAKMKDEGTIPSYTKPRATLLNRKRRRPKQRAFLKAYGRLVHIGLAAKAAHIDESAHRRWLRKDAWYARLFDQIKRKVTSNPPATRVRKKKNLRRPAGVGSVMPRSYGCMVEWYGTDPDGQRRARRERLENVSQADAWRYVLERVKADPPKRGPLRYGHFPSIESLLHPNYEQVPKTALSITKPPGRRNRPVGMGSIHLNKNSVAITWFDTQRQRHMKI